MLGLTAAYSMTASDGWVPVGSGLGGGSARVASALLDFDGVTDRMRGYSASTAAPSEGVAAREGVVLPPPLLVARGERRTLRSGRGKASGWSLGACRPARHPGVSSALVPTKRR